MKAMLFVHKNRQSNNGTYVHMRLVLLLIRSQSLFSENFNRRSTIYMWRAFLEGYPKALKVNEGALRGDVSKESAFCLSLQGKVGIWSSSIGSSDSWRI